jgi:hypothetical protein
MFLQAILQGCVPGQRCLYHCPRKIICMHNWNIKALSNFHLICSNWTFIRMYNFNFSFITRKQNSKLDPSISTCCACSFCGSESFNCELVGLCHVVFLICCYQHFREHAVSIIRVELCAMPIMFKQVQRVCCKQISGYSFSQFGWV